MKKTLYIFFFLVGTLHFAQGTSDNRFKEGETESVAFNSHTGIEAGELPDTPSSGGNPADGAPIDDYIPLLIITALGIIIYKARKNKNLLS